MTHLKMIIAIITISLAIGITAFAADNGPITESNWLNHPQIIGIRAIINEIEGALKANKLKELHHDFGYDNPGLPISKMIYVDNANIPRKFIEEWGSGDSALTFSYYYDETKALRFVFIKGGAVNGSEMEHRIYFDSKGKRIWENQKYLKGPGYTFPEVWPEDELIKDPWQEYQKKSSSYNS